MTPRGLCSATLAASIALCSAVAAAAADGVRAWQVEAGVGGDRLSNAAPNWSQLDLSLRRQLAPRSQAELTMRRTRRSGLDDEELGAAVGLPLDADWSAAAALTLSPSHRVLARGGARVELARSFGGGWVANLSFGRRLYAVQGGAAAGNSQLAAGIERYLGPWRLAAQSGRTRLDGGAGAGNLRLQADHYFDAERGRVGLIVARGRELEGLPATPFGAADVIDQRVGTVALAGVLPLAGAWALAWEASRVRHDDLQRRSGAPAAAPYHRSGVRLGVRHDF